MRKSPDILGIGLVAALVAMVGCSPGGIEPRVIADRVDDDNSLAIILTSFPGQPTGGLVVTDVSPALFSDPFTVGETANICVESLPAVRVNLTPAADADRIVARLSVIYNGGRYVVTVPFDRREVTVPAEGGRVERWVAGSESIRYAGRNGTDGQSRPSTGYG
jgi:hypothetical protein